MVKVLVVDDEAQVGRICAHFLQKAGWEADCASSAEEALGLIQAGDKYGIIFLDIRMPEKDGIETLKEIKKVKPNVEVVMITAHGNTEIAVECMRLGACDFVSKPFKKERVLAAVARATRFRSLHEEVNRLQSEIQSNNRFENLIGRSRSMQHVYDWIARSSETNGSVLVLGESGTGKDLVARTIHYNSERRGKPFIAVNCAALPRELIESELFGHCKGSFTGAVSDSVGIFRAADGGTVFLDEIVEMPPSAQAKLLRVLQEQKVRPVGATEEISVDVRIVSATNRDISRAVEDGSFREDLYYRVSVISFRVPPLRERQGDLEALVKHFLARFNGHGKKRITGIDAAAMEAMGRYRWGGNVRELENVIERCAVMTRSGTISLKDLPDEITRAGADGGVAQAPVMKLAEAEKRAVRRALQVARGNISKGARLLGITRKRLYRLARAHGLKL